MSNLWPNALRCPCCGTSFHFNETGKSLLCEAPKRHCFDLSAEGYVNLSGNQQGGGDSPEAIRSRTAFLDSGAYAPIARKLSEMLLRHLPVGASVLDAGCGEGYYSMVLAESGFDIVGVDLSRAGVRAAAKRAKRSKEVSAHFAVGNLYEIPLADASVSAVVNVFAPCVESEFSRVLCDGGFLAVAYAGPDHLMGLKRALYDSVYQNEERADMPKNFRLLEEERVEFDLHVESREQIESLFAMTPYYWRTSREDHQKLSQMEEIETEIDVKIALFQKVQ